MKRLIVLLPLLLLAGMATTALAGDYHKTLTLICSDCHIMHYSQSHGYQVGGSVFPALANGPNAYLLRAGDVNQTCLACHNGNTFYPDVFGDNVLGSASVRLAGGLNAETGHGLTNDAGYDVIDGHTLYSTDVPPGNTGGTMDAIPAEGLECSSCHAVHGAVSYRNLMLRSGTLFAGDTVSYAAGANDLTKDVFEHANNSYTYGDVDYNEPIVTNSKYAIWCQNCHTKFHGTDMTDPNMGDGTDYHRHPTASANISTASASDPWRVRTNKVKVMSPTGDWSKTATGLTPSCMSCHKAHGNKNGFGLVFMAGTGTITEEGDGGAYRDMCRQCHSRGN
jgi:hypothetical protein